MKALLAMIGFFSFAMVFGFALVATKWNERYEYQGIDEDEER